MAEVQFDFVHLLLGRFERRENVLEKSLFFLCFRVIGQKLCITMSKKHNDEKKAWDVRDFNLAAQQFLFVLFSCIHWDLMRLNVNGPDLSLVFFVFFLFIQLIYVVTSIFYFTVFQVGSLYVAINVTSLFYVYFVLILFQCCIFFLFSLVFWTRTRWFSFVN